MMMMMNNTKAPSVECGSLSIVVATLVAIVLVVSWPVGAASVSSLDARLEIEQCGIEANRLPQLFVPERYDLVLNATNLGASSPSSSSSSSGGKSSSSFTAQVIIRARYTDILASTPRVTFLWLIKKICRSVIACGFDRERKLRKRQILLNVGRSLVLEDVQVSRYVEDARGAEQDQQQQPKPKDGKLAQVAIEEICFDQTNELMAITLAEKLTRDEQINIRIEYRGRVRSDSHGLYESLNRASVAAAAAAAGDRENGGAPARFVEVAAANTHFFPADARTTFPCMDQPDMKAVFSLRLIHNKDLVAVSNMGPVSSQLDKATGTREVQFADTPRMSSYLFAFAVGQYETLRCQAGGKTRPLVTAYAPPGRAAEAHFTLDTICRAIPLVESYLRREFPLSKLDLVSTRQMADPARESWGMLVFTEEFLLSDPLDTTLVVREEIAKLAVHVLLHHWWGNLATTSWWDDQWLFDGFTIWRSHALTAQLYPEFSYDFNYLLRLQSPTLDAHTSGQVRPIKTYQDLGASQELKLFDENTYNKAAALFHMTNAMLGEFVMRDSLVKFIDAHAYSNGNVKNFTQALESTSGLVGLEDYLKSWLDQAGVPLVSVARSTAGGRNEIELKQERLLDGPITWTPPDQGRTGAGGGGGGSGGESKQAEVWTIPIDIVFSDSNNMIETVRITLREAKTRVAAPIWFRHHDPKHWFKLNAQFNGFYRVSYARTVLARLRAPVEQQLLSPQDRFNIIDDLRALYTLGRVDAGELEQVLDWFKNEQHGGVLSGLALAVDEMSSRGSHARADEVVQKLFGPTFERHRYKVLEGDGEGDNVTQNHADLNGRQDALTQLIKHNQEPATEEAVQVFEASNVHLEPFLRQPVYLAVIKRGSEAQLDELVERLSETKSQFERSILVNYLIQFVGEENEELKERLLATLNDNSQL